MNILMSDTQPSSSDMILLYITSQFIPKKLCNYIVEKRENGVSDQLS